MHTNLTSSILSQMCIAAICTATGASISHAQCEPHWLPGDGVPGADGPVYAMMTWDPDAAGPLPPLVIVGGDFLAIGDAIASRIAAWDGRRWHAMGGGMNAAVRCLGVYKGDLVAGGEFTVAGGVGAKRIARWDAASAQWQPIGAGVDSGVVGALIEYNGDLIAGGGFVILSNPWTLYIARYNGESWQAMGSFDSSVGAFIIHDGSLIAAGSFTNHAHIARWSGSDWQELGGGVNGLVSSLALQENDLIAGGNFTVAGDTPVSRVARWKGTHWEAMGDQFTNHLHALIVHDQQVFAAGWFPTEPLGTHTKVMRWIGSEWIQVGGNFDKQVYRLAGYGQQLLAVGEFNKSGDRTVARVAHFDQTQQAWKPLTFAPVLSIGPFTKYDGRWIAAGRFLNTDGTTRYAVAGWDDSTERWRPFGADINALALTVYNGDLVAGGAFTAIDGVPINRVARWNGKTWLPLGEGIGGENAQVNALIEFEGDLFAGGVFSTAGKVEAKYVARWHGTTGQWNALSSGLEGYDEYETAAHSMAIYQDALIVAGHFRKAGGVTVNSIARWDGASWSAVGTANVGVLSTVYDLAIFRNNLIAAGDSWTMLGLARWDGASWYSMVGTFNSGYYGANAYALTVWRNQLIFGGWFSNIDGLLTQSIARWNGETWRPIDGGIAGSTHWLNYGSNIVRQLGVHDDTLFVGGKFSIAGEHMSAYIARAAIPSPPADIDCDGLVNGNDVIAVIDQWGPCPALPQTCGADVDGNGVVNVDDLLMVIANWG